MNDRNFLSSYVQPTVISGLVFLVLFFAATTFTKFKEGQWEKDVRSNLLNVLTGKKSNLEKALYSRIYYTRGVAAYVSLNPSISNNEFSELAKEYIRNDSVINSLALSKDCIINSIYPLKGHEAAIGLNLLDHPERKEIVEKTIETHLTFVAGPVELVEGGIAFISYTPIFDKTSNVENKFWGVTDIVIRQNALLNEAGLNLTESGYSFALRGYNGQGENGAVFWGDENVFSKNPVSISIELPMGSWELAAIPENGWAKYQDQDKTLFIILLLSAFIISTLIWLFSRALFKIRNNEKELLAVFNSLDSLIMEFNVKGDYLKINSENQDLLFIPIKQLEGKNIKDIFDKEPAEFFLEALQKCISTKKIVVIEYPLQIKGKEHWFLSRLSYKSGNTAIINAYDITDRKEQEQQLITSEKELKEMNEMKNKFFSVVAHDIKGPLGSQNSIINLLMEEFDNMDKPTFKKLLHSLSDSSHSLFNLLEDLLKWSLSQSGKIEVTNENFKLKDCANNVLTGLEKESHLKNIQIVNELNDETVVFGDINLTKTILRNLLSNAIKFTNPKGQIRIFTEKLIVDGKSCQEIFVEDNGVGMNPEVVETLFVLNKTQSRLGTSNEKGNGLGLLLCKEFAEKQNTKITVTSSPGKGSTFSFKLPAV